MPPPSITPKADARAAVTLLELLVVIVILSLLVVSIVPNIAPTSDQRCREAALTLTAAITRAQSRAAKNAGRGAGLWIQPLETTTMTDGDTRRGASDLFTCEPQDTYNGDVADIARVFVTGTSLISDLPEDVTVVAFSMNACPLIDSICAQSSRIKIPGGSAGGTEYFFRLKSPAERETLNNGFYPAPYRPFVTGDPPYTTEDIRPNDGVAVALIKLISDTDVLPTPTASQFDPSGPAGLPGESVGTEFAIFRPVTRSATPPLSLPSGFVVDTAWCSVGDRLLTNSLSILNGTPASMKGIPNFLSNYPIHIMFNESTGATEKLRFKTALSGFGIVDDEYSVTSDIYLLVGRADRAGNSFVPSPQDDSQGANWQYPDSRWVRIGRSTGETLVSDPMLRVSDVKQSQTYARLGLSASRK